jgi:hypothetical protein
VKPEELLNGKQLAAALGRSPCYITAMIHAGYVFKYTGLRKTTLRHALAALTDTEFSARYYLLPGWQARPKVLAAKKDSK